MGQPTITGFMIALILVGFFVGIFGTFYSSLADNYGTDYQEDSLAVYQKLDEINAQTKEYKEDIEEATANKNIVQQGWDIAGGILSAGLTSLKISAQSVTVFFRMAQAGTDEMASSGMLTSSTARSLFSMIGSIVIILLFLGIILPAIIRWNKKL